jgi:hypothetical protein
MIRRFAKYGAVVALASGAAPAAASGPPPGRLAPVHGTYAPTIDPARFVRTIDNPYLPYLPGTTIRFRGQVDGAAQTDVEVVLHRTRRILGVRTTIVRDTVFADGTPIERTDDYYAQDRDGNVWYFGEATKEFKDGTVDTAGSFAGGVNGALPGIILPGHPQMGDQYRQEYAKGVAKDTGDVLSLTGSETTPLTGPAKDLLVTKDTDLLDPTGPGENKYYARGAGLILTVQTTGPAERDQAIAVEKF